MKPALLICCVLALVLPGLTCTPEAVPSISVTEGSLSVSVADVDGGVTVTNVSTVALIVLVRSPEGEQHFELAVGESITVTGITKPIELSAVSL